MKFARIKRAVGIPMGCVLVLAGSLTWLTYHNAQHALAEHELLQAISQHNPSAVEDALRRGADPNTRQSGSPSSATLMQYLKSLLSKDAAVKERGPSALVLATPKEMLHEDAARSARIIALLLQHGADPNVRDERGMTVMMWAALAGNQEVARLLLESGCQIEAKDPDGRTALWFAANSGSMSIVDTLLQKGADINTAGKNSGSPLMGAVWSGSPKMVAYLLKKGADTSTQVIVKDDIKVRRITALTIARSSPVQLRRSIVPLLQQAGAK